VFEADAQGTMSGRWRAIWAGFWAVSAYLRAAADAGGPVRESDMIPWKNWRLYVMSRVWRGQPRDALLPVETALDESRRWRHTADAARLHRASRFVARTGCAQ